MKYLFIIAALAVWFVSAPFIPPSYAQGDHSAHVSEESHEDHSDDHQDETEDHDETAHNDEHSEHEEQEDHEEGSSKITPESAKRMGIVLEKAIPAMVDQTLPLTGRITLNQNTKADIRARFPGIVRSVKVNLGESVEAGQILAVIEANDSLRNYNVTSPISGVVLQRATNTGDVASDQRLFVIADLSDVWAKFHVFPRDADSVQNGQTVRIHTLDDDASEQGKIDMLFPTADALSQTQIAIIVLDNTTRIWKPGMTIEGDVTVSQKQAAITVRESALQKMEEFGDVVFVQNGQNYEPRPVMLGNKANGIVEIVDGIKAGETYVSEGSFIVKSDILKSTAAHSH